MNTDSSHSEMPQGWRNLPLRSSCLKTEFTDPTKSSHKSFRYVDVSAVSNELWKIISSAEHTGSTAPSRARKLVKAGDVIFATVRPTLRRVAMVPDHLDGQVVSTAFCVIRANPIQADACFIYYSVLTDEFLDRIGNVQRGASYPAVTDGDVLRQEIPVPPLSEQRAIAVLLSKIQAAVEMQEKIVANLKELKGATMAKLFREGLRGEPLKQTEIGEIPQSWEVACVGHLLKLGSGQSRPQDLSPERNAATPFPVYGGNGVMGYSSQYNTDRESIVIGRVGAYCGSVHVCPAHSWVTDNALFHRGPISEQVSLSFLAELLTFLRLNRLRRKGAQPLITQGTVHAVKIPLPPKPEQEELARAATLLGERIGAGGQELRVIKAAFSSMLHLLMTGRVRVTRRMIALQALEDRRKRRPKWSGKVDDKLLGEIVRRVVEAVAPEKIILFGSAARGEMGPDSDLDLLVVKTCDSPREVERVIYRRLIGIGVPKDVLVVTPEHLEKHKETIGYIYRPALREGKVIYAG